MFSKIMCSQHTDSVLRCRRIEEEVDEFPLKYECEECMSNYGHDANCKGKL